MALALSLKPCGPVVDDKAAVRAREFIGQALWTDRLEQAWPALAPVFAASPYLASLARRDPQRLDQLLAADPDARLDDILRRTAAAADLNLEDAKARLRELKAELHLLTALCDLGGVWDLDQVTGGLTRFADAAVASALVVAARGEVEAGRLARLGEGAAGPVPGWFCF